MKRYRTWAAAILAGFGAISSGKADTTIATFDENFYMDGLFAWADATVVADANGYSITDTGYGSGYKDINPNIDATGETTIEVRVTITAATGPSDPASGPIVSLVDGDGTFVNFAWFGQTIGTHTLTAALNSPSWQTQAGTVPGLNLATLDFFHLQDDPGAHTGQYTIRWEIFRLTGKTEPTINITAYAFNNATKEFTLTWSSKTAKNYTVLQSATVNGTYDPLVIDVPSGGETTTTTVTMPAGNAGFLRILEQP
jgi:hypothetical protein